MMQSGKRRPRKTHNFIRKTERNVIATRGRQVRTGQRLWTTSWQHHPAHSTHRTPVSTTGSLWSRGAHCPGADVSLSTPAGTINSHIPRLENHPLWSSFFSKRITGEWLPLFCAQVRNSRVFPFFHSSLSRLTAPE